MISLSQLTKTEGPSEFGDNFQLGPTPAWTLEQRAGKPPTKVDVNVNWKPSVSAYVLMGVLYASIGLYAFTQREQISENLRGAVAEVRQYGK
jgi:hypothetical protein